jgi:hypothetical protein
MPLIAMPGSPFKKLLLMILVMATGAVLLLEFLDARFKPKSEAMATKLAKSAFQYHYSPLRPKVSGNAETSTETDANERKQLKIPGEKAEAWLAKHTRNAASLLALFRRGGGKNYLYEAATNFPGDPQVQLAVLTSDAFPDERRKWLEAFKASSPGNSLANYLSAADYFKNGNPDAAVQELLAASGKTEFKNFAMEAQLDAEELALFYGAPADEVGAYGLGERVSANMQIVTLRQLAVAMGDLMTEKSEAGDPASVQNLARMGLILADRMRSGESGRISVNCTVGYAIESVILSRLDQGVRYDILDGQTPAESQQKIKDALNDTKQVLNQFQDLEDTMSAEEKIAYMQRLKIDGEIEAMKWVIQQHPPAASQSP